MHSIGISICNLLSVSSSFFSSSCGRTTSITHFPPFVSPRMFSSSTSWTVLPSEDSNLSKPNFRISLSFIKQKRKFSTSIFYFHTNLYDSSFSDINGKVVKVKKSIFCIICQNTCTLTCSFVSTPIETGSCNIFPSNILTQTGKAIFLYRPNSKNGIILTALKKLSYSQKIWACFCPTS